MHFGVSTGPHVLAVPGGVRQTRHSAGRTALQQGQSPGALLGETLQGFPIAHTVEADQRLGNGMRCDVESEAGNPLDKALPAALLTKTAGHAQEQGLPERPQSVSVPGGTSWLRG